MIFYSTHKKFSISTCCIFQALESDNSDAETAEEAFVLERVQFCNDLSINRVSDQLESWITFQHKILHNYIHEFGLYSSFRLWFDDLHLFIYLVSLILCVPKCMLLLLFHPITSSHQLCGIVLLWFLREIEVKQRWARLVHGWVTMAEVRRTVGRLNAAQKPLSNDNWCYTAV